LGEDLAADYELARRGYFALEQNFDSLGDPDAARRAYLKKRRMQKWDARRRAQAAWAAGRWREATLGYLAFAGDQVAEWVCDYGESIPRVLASLLWVYLLFTIIYGVTGTVFRVSLPPEPPQRTVTRSPVDLAMFSLTSMTSPGNPPEWLLPRNEAAHLLAGTQALLSIFLTGLLGFVAGNRIRR
jgi:hypothetical protein